MNPMQFGIAIPTAADSWRLVRRAEELAKLAPENPEFVPAIDKQTYKASDTFVEKTAAITPPW